MKFIRLKLLLLNNAGIIIVQDTLAVATSFHGLWRLIPRSLWLNVLVAVFIWSIMLVDQGVDRIAENGHLSNH